MHKSTETVADDASFAHLLSESFLFLYDQDHDAHHLTVVRRALLFLHGTGRDSNGNYSSHWDKARQPQDKVSLLAEASAARADLVASQYHGLLSP